MSAKVTWDPPLAELRRQLLALPADLAAEGSTIVDEAALRAKNEIEAAYPERSGSLKKGLRLKVRQLGQYGAAVVLANTSPDSHLFENGTQARHTNIGANRGSMPARPTFVPAVRRSRRWMYEQFKALLTRAGLRVSGDA